MDVDYVYEQDRNGNLQGGRTLFGRLHRRLTGHMRSYLSLRSDPYERNR